MLVEIVFIAKRPNFNGKTSMLLEDFANPVVNGHNNNANEIAATIGQRIGRRRTYGATR